MKARLALLGLIVALLAATWALLAWPALAGPLTRDLTPAGMTSGWNTGSSPAVTGWAADGRVAATLPYTSFLPLVVQAPLPVIQAPVNEMIALINAERARHGLAPLRIQPILVQLAEAHSQDMVDRDFYSHTNPDGLDACDRFDRAGYVWSWCGENVGAGYASAQEMFDVFMKSPGHQKNFLSPEFTEIGVGYAVGGRYGYYWTIDLGRPM